jgi:hypothetical protein
MSAGKTPVSSEQRNITMNVSSELKGTTLILSIDVSPKALAAAIVSKSGAAKALAAGKPEPKPSVVASTGGFVMCGPVKVAVNAILA